MPELDYSGLVRTVVGILKDDPALRAIEGNLTVTDERIQASTETVPFVGVKLLRIVHEPVHIVGGYLAGQPDTVKALLAFYCYHFDAQNTGAADRQRDRVVRAVVECLRTHVTLGNRVLWVQVDTIDFPDPPEQGSPFSIGVVNATASLFA